MQGKKEVSVLGRTSQESELVFSECPRMSRHSYVTLTTCHTLDTHPQVRTWQALPRMNAHPRASISCSPRLTEHGAGNSVQQFLWQPLEITLSRADC